jgi:hypothetical protein
VFYVCTYLQCAFNLDDVDDICARTRMQCLTGWLRLLMLMLLLLLLLLMLLLQRLLLLKLLLMLLLLVTAEHGFESRVEIALSVCQVTQIPHSEVILTDSQGLCRAERRAQQ